ncbi:MAG TPA: prolipoprotein diacylglyceryl transferase [Thermoanaerobaculia bacterium]|jgi:phosphatidylglycerol:prolipoprotein diacylglycerol transferase|nr:prolipoprotein diacylglyceryl transferase [Thermoanaerobaculia bacterium]
MIRELFHLGPLSISPFGVMLMLAFLAAYAQLAWGLKKLGAGDADDASTLMLWAGLAGIVGGKIYYAALYRDWHLLFDRSGLVWYGGFLAGTAAAVWVIRRRRLPVWRTVDATSLGLALGYGIGRIGCFLVGDDYGKPTDLPWAVAFPVGLPATTAGELRSAFGVNVPASVPDDTLLRVHPTQLYETLLALAIWGVGLWLLRRRPREGAVALTVIGLLAVERFAIEFLRAKDDRFLGPLTLAQAISLAVLAAVVALALWRRRSEAGEDAPSLARAQR